MSDVKNVPYQGVGYNACELASLSPELVKKEVEHHFKNDPQADAKIKELHDLCKKACPDAEAKDASKPVEKPVPASLTAIKQGGE